LHVFLSRIISNPAVVSVSVSETHDSSNPAAPPPGQRAPCQEASQPAASPSRLQPIQFNSTTLFGEGTITGSNVKRVPGCELKVNKNTRFTALSIPINHHHHSLSCLSLPHLCPTALTGSPLSFTSCLYAGQLYSTSLSLPLRLLCSALLCSRCLCHKDKPGTAYSRVRVCRTPVCACTPQEDLFLAHDPPVLPLLQDEQRNVSPPTLTPLVYSPPASQ
jgi:hypothetical protein